MNVTALLAGRPPHAPIHIIIISTHTLTHGKRDAIILPIRDPTSGTSRQHGPLGEQWPRPQIVSFRTFHIHTYSIDSFSLPLVVANSAPASRTPSDNK